MNVAYKQKIETIKSLRAFLLEKGVVEVFTPVTRKTSCEPIRRIKTECGPYLRNCQELQLRLMMEYYGDVFEIGPSFRREDREDETHGFEFTLCEVQFSGKDLGFLISLLKEYIGLYRKDVAFEEVSVADETRRLTGIDLAADGEAALMECLKRRYPDFAFQQNFHLVNHFIQKEIEPLSRGRHVFFVDYPACTLSLARYADPSKEIVRRFEFFVNGIEVSNGYENSTDVDEFIKRNQKVEMFTDEERYLAERLNDGSVPLDTAIIGIGVERLCMAIYGITDIRLLLHENPVF